MALVEGFFGAEDQLSEPASLLWGLRLYPSRFLGSADQRQQLGLQVVSRFDVDAERFVRSASRRDDNTHAPGMGDRTDGAGRPTGAPVRFRRQRSRRKAELLQQPASEPASGRILADSFGDRAGDSFGLFRQEVLRGVVFGDRCTRDADVGAHGGRQPSGQRGDLLFGGHGQCASSSSVRTRIVTTPHRDGQIVGGIEPSLALSNAAWQGKTVLSDRERRLIRLFSAAVRGEWESVRQVRREAASDEPDRAWRETVLMVHLFAGFPRQVETYGVLEEVGGLGTVAAEEREASADQPDRGRVLFDRIYGAQSDRVVTALGDGHPDVPGWILGHAYGRVLTRPGLDARMRELLAVSALAVLQQKRQLMSHALGAIRCGATMQELRAVVAAIADTLTAEQRRTVSHVFDRIDESDAS